VLEDAIPPDTDYPRTIYNDVELVENGFNWVSIGARCSTLSDPGPEPVTIATSYSTLSLLSKSLVKNIAWSRSVSFDSSIMGPRYSRFHWYSLLMKCHCYRLLVVL
jgi:hypothetical protein